MADMIRWTVMASAAGESLGEDEYRLHMHIGCVSALLGNYWTAAELRQIADELVRRIDDEERRVVAKAEALACAK